MAKSSITKTSTKNEILDAYESLVKKVSEQDNLKPQEIRDKAEKQAVVEKVSGITPETIVREIAGLKLKVATSFDQVGDALLSEQKKLAEVQHAIDVQKKVIEELYEVKVTADSLAAMLLAHREKKQQMEAEALELTVQLEQRTEDYESEMARKKVEWEKEKTRIQAELKEEKERAQKSHQREEEEYNYNLQLKRRKEQDVYEEKRRKTEQEFSAMVADKEKSLQEREEEVSTKEEEFEKMRLKIAGFDEELSRALKEAEKSATDKLKVTFGFEKELLLKEQEGLIKLKDQTIQTLETRIREMEAYVKQLTQKTEQADKSVKDIAIKAIESSSKVTLYENPAGKKSSE